MTQNGAKRQCRNCDFCRQIGEAMLCVRNAPAPDPTTGDALWPHVRPTDYCGQFCGGADQNRPSSLVAREAQIPADVSRDSCPVTRDSQLAADASHGSSPVARRSQAEIHNQSGRNAAADPSSKSSIVNSKSQIGLPICEDEFGPYCKIPLTQNRFAKVDPADYIWLSQFRWCCKTGKDRCYAVRHIQERGRTKRIHMHRQIMNTPDNMICDHKNHNGLDNRKTNLRNCTMEQNNANRRKRATGHGAQVTSSQYLGVSWCPRRKKWVSYIKHKGKARNLGLYDIETDAARAHDKAAWETWGEYACLNFPDEYPGHPAAKKSISPQRHRGHREDMVSTE
jgi:hypothetical protein